QAEAKPDENKQDDGTQPVDTSKATPNAANAAEKPADAKEEPKLVVAQVFVKPGRRSDIMVEITKGLKKGDVVVTAGPKPAQPGLCREDRQRRQSGEQGQRGTSNKMNFSDIFIRRPVLSTVVALMIMLLGAQGLQNLTIREYPKVEETVITISTAYAGA